MGLFTTYKGLENEQNVKYKNIPFNEDNSFNSQPFIQTAPPGDGGGFKVASNVKGFIPKLTSGLTAGALNLTDGLSKTVPSLGAIARGAYRSATDVVRLTKFMTTPIGIEFILKQELLSRMSVQTETSGKLNNGVYNPLSTLAQAGVSFAGIHLPPYEPLIGYGEVAYSAGQINPNLYGNNRLVGLHDTHILRQSPVPNILRRYDGGPGSIFGVGATDIKFATNPAGITPVRTMGANFIFLEGTPKNPRLYQAQYDSSLVPSYEDGKNTLAEYYNMGRPGSVSYGPSGNRTPKSKSFPLDRVNSRFIYSSDSEPLNEPEQYRDLVTFKIGVLDVGSEKTNYMQFRSIIDSFSDSYSSDWSSQTYMGRGEKLYKYNSFDRSINMSFTVVAQSQAEIFGMYQKLNYLASTVTPQYTDYGYMTGNITKLTVGNYVKDQHGKIDSISFEIPEESPWVTDGIDFLQTRMNEMPFIIKVQMRYTVIHDFRPELVTNILDTTKSGETISKFGDQRYITSKIDKDNPDYQINLTKELDEITATANSVNRGNVIPSLYYSRPKATPPPVSTTTPISQTPLQLKNGQLLENSGDNSPGFSKNQGGQYSNEDNSSNFSKSQGDPFPSSNNSSTQKSTPIKPKKTQNIFKSILRKKASVAST